MKKPLLTVAVLVLLLATARAANTYVPVADWLKLPEGRAQLGNQHGDVAVSSTGDVYVSVQDPRRVCRSTALRANSSAT
jgi:hypothetical protein